ncbi:MAG: hypothetical protein J1F42_14265 [Lachnospiraceae bacterium]|nr:hypothetical protein [Lachnospiraceae bacterium]
MSRKLIAEIIGDLYLVIRRTAVIIMCLLMVLVAIWGAAKIEKYIHRNYIQLGEGDIWYKYKETANYRRCIRYNGKPNKEMIGTIANDSDLQYWLLYYDDMVVSYNYSEEDVIGHRHQVLFWTDDYSFGDKHVSVGMSREQIEKIFRYSKKSTPNGDYVDVWDENGNGERFYIISYFDDAYAISVGFLYDDDDCVSMIAIGEGIY